MLDQPPPQPTSAIRAPGRLSASCTDGTPASAPGSCRSYQGRFMSAWDSRASGAELLPADAAAVPVGVQQRGHLDRGRGEHPSDGRQVGEAGLVGEHLGRGRGDRVAAVGRVVGVLHRRADRSPPAAPATPGRTARGCRSDRRARPRCRGRPPSGCGTSRGGRRGRWTGGPRPRERPRRCARPAPRPRRPARPVIPYPPLTSAAGPPGGAPVSTETGGPARGLQSGTTRGAPCRPRKRTRPWYAGSTPRWTRATSTRWTSWSPRTTSTTTRRPSRGSTRGEPG